MRTRETNQSGFTLIEILIAMTILVVGGVGIISLFAAAVALQYDSVVNEQEAAVISDVVAEAQQVLNRHMPTADQPLPPPLERKPSANYRDFEYEVSFERREFILPGEGAVARIRLYYRGAELDTEDRVLQKTVFSPKEIKESISEEMDRKADEEAKRREEKAKER
jgi:prepilin-type N-terminal cleavage/methylation domain-containing protein